MSISRRLLERKQSAGSAEGLGLGKASIASQENVELNNMAPNNNTIRYCTSVSSILMSSGSVRCKNSADCENRIPNIPFFYVLFRAYSHYRALYGGKLLEHLTSKDLIKITDSPQMDEMYTAGLLHPTRKASREAPRPTSAETEQVARVVEAQTHGNEEDVMVLQRWNGKLIAEAFKLPEMEVEIERAVEQVEKAIEKERTELDEEKKEVMQATEQKRDMKNPEVR